MAGWMKTVVQEELVVEVTVVVAVQVGFAGKPEIPAKECVPVVIVGFVATLSPVVVGKEA
jgi:hypothetical protein